MNTGFFACPKLAMQHVIKHAKIIDLFIIVNSFIYFHCIIHNREVISNTKDMRLPRYLATIDDVNTLSGPWGRDFTSLKIIHV